MNTAAELFDIWKHAGYDECVDQIEAHLESQGMPQHEIDIEIQKLQPQFDYEFGI